MKTIRTFRLRQIGDHFGLSDGIESEDGEIIELMRGMLL